MSQFWYGNLLLLISVLLASGSQVVFKKILNITGPLGYNPIYFSNVLNFRVIFLFSVAFVMLIAGFLFWIMSLSRLDLSYAYPIACASALFVALFSVLFLGEVVTVRMLFGILLIVFGTVLLAVPR